MNKGCQHYSLCGIRVDAITQPDMLEEIAAAKAAGRKLIILNHNLHSIYLYTKLEAFREAYRLATDVYVDGMPVIWLARLAGLPFTPNHRITFLDCLEGILKVAADRGWRVYYLGSDAETLAQGLSLLRAQHPDLTIAGEHGYLGPHFETAPQAIARLNEFRPDVVFLGMGMPLQEKFLELYASQIHATAIMTSGATMDYVAGKAYKPPAWAGPLGLYGVFRLFSDPKRLWKRYLYEPSVLFFTLWRPLLRQRRSVARGASPELCPCCDVSNVTVSPVPKELL